MEKSGEKKAAKAPGSRLMPMGVMLLVMSIVLLVISLSATTERYVPGVGYVETGGTPSGAFWVFLLSGLLLAGIGFARRVLSSK